jgi:hypothetical protein
VSGRGRSIEDDWRAERRASVYSTTALRKYLKRRDKAITLLYLEYGAEEVMRVTGWTKPTIMGCVRRVRGD